MTKKIFLNICLLMILSSISFGQKLGFVNYNELFTDIPEVKKIDIQINTLKKQMQSKGEAMVVEFQKAVQEYEAETKSGTVSQVESQKKETSLLAKRDAIEKYDQEVNQKLTEKKQELLTPILNNINTAIKTVGKNEGYTMILDSSQGALVFMSEADNLKEKIKIELHKSEKSTKTK